jgi:hypothetical protein
LPHRFNHRQTFGRLKEGLFISRPSAEIENEYVIPLATTQRVGLRPAGNDVVTSAHCERIIQVVAGYLILAA